MEKCEIDKKLAIVGNETKMGWNIFDICHIRIQAMQCLGVYEVYVADVLCVVLHNVDDGSDV